MKKFLNTALIVLTLVSGGLKAFSKELSADFIRNRVANMVSDELSAKGYLDVDVKVINLPFQTVNLPEGNLQLKLLSNNNTLYSKRCIRTLQIFVNNKFEYSLGVPLEINASTMALVASKQIDRDQSVNAINVVLQKIEINSNLPYLLDTKALSKDMIATKLYRQGEFIDKRFVRTRADIEKNEIVTVLFKTDGAIAVTVSAKALSAGSLGDTVSVQNSQNKKIYYGRVIDRNQVQVNI